VSRRRRFLAALWLGVALAGSAVAASGQDRYFVTSDGVRLHYLEAGTGDRTLVFIPGWLMPAAVFGQQVESLSQHYRVLALDPRSHGLSQVYSGAHTPTVRVRDIDEWLAAAKVSEFVLAGWSLGVLEGLDYLERFRPSGLRGLILIDNSIGEGTPPAPRSSAFFEKLADPARREALLKEFCAGLFRQAPPPGLLDAVQASALRVPATAARQTLAQPYPRTYWRDIVLRQEVPLLYAITPRFRDQGDALAAKRPALSNVLIFEQAGHALFVDEPARFNAAALALARRAFGAD
jgi:microsomal epoxide hydrolase